METNTNLSIKYVLIGRTGKVALTVSVADAAAKVFKTDILDELAREKAKTDILTAFSGLNTPERSAAVAAELLGIADDTAKALGPKAEAPAVGAGAEDTSAADLLAEMPQEVRDEAAAMLSAPDLFRRVVVDIAAVGVAGECELTATIYLDGTSRLLDRPLAVILQGLSSSGKSFPIRKVSELFPPEAVIYATQMSPQALFYMEPGSLVHKFIVAGERSRRDDDEAAEVTRALREMISEGRLDKRVAMKTSSGIKTVHLHQDGPIAYVESTTTTKIFDEDANRALVLQTDERSEQTRRVIQAVAANFDGTRRNEERDRIIQRHWAAQRMLTPRTVVIPYAGRLADAFPDQRVEARRAIGHVLGMVAASALLHQRQRLVDADGRLMATAEDYQIARRLLDKPMARLLGRRISDAARRFYDRLVTWAVGIEFSAHDAVPHEEVTERTVRTWLSELYSAGYVNLVKAGHAHEPNRWQLAKVPPPGQAVAVLPTVEELFLDSDFRPSGKAQPIETASLAPESPMTSG